VRDFRRRYRAGMRSVVIRTLLVIGLVAGIISIVVAIVDLVNGSAAWSAWMALICGAFLIFLGVFRLARTFEPRA